MGSRSEHSETECWRESPVAKVLCTQSCAQSTRSLGPLDLCATERLRTDPPVRGGAGLESGWARKGPRQDPLGQWPGSPGCPARWDQRRTSRLGLIRERFLSPSLHLPLGRVGSRTQVYPSDMLGTVIH